MHLLRMRDQETVWGIIIAVLIWQTFAYWGYVSDEELEPVLDYQLKFDVNKVPRKYFRILPGVGKKLTEAIIDYREKHGAFKKVDELINVRGIGPKKLEAMRPFLFIAEKGRDSDQQRKDEEKKQ